jgi:uncharacterized membrane protein
MPSYDARWRSIAKAMTWRLVGSLDTLVLSWFFTGNLVVAGTIASVETLTKTVLYYLHERAWGIIPQGRG